MADIADDSNDTAEFFLEAALRTRRGEGPKPNGYCHYCEAPVTCGKRWCDEDCRDDWEREQKRA